MRTFIPVFLIAASACLPVRAITTCFLTQNPQTVRSEGITERLGDLRLACNGGAPYQALTGTLSVAIDSTLTNKDLGDDMVDIRLSLLVGGSYVQVLGSAKRVSPGLAAFSGINLNFDVYGGIALLISNVRASGRTSVAGAVSFSGTPSLLVTTPFVRMSNPVPSLLAGFSYMAPTQSNELPGPVDFNSLIALSVPHVATRFTEGTAAAFEVKSTGMDIGTRLMVRYRNMPANGRILVPDYIVGRPAFTPTSAGDFGTVTSPGVYQARPNGALFLSRVRASDINGAGGVALGMGGPGPMGEADRYENFFQAVYEVMDSDPAVLESAQVPAFLWIPAGAVVKDLIRQSASYAPLSDVMQSSTTEPVPRFLMASAPSDCAGVGDCSASYFPHLLVTPSTDIDLEARQGDDPKTTFLTIKNDGGSVLEWSTQVSYLDGDSWLLVQPPSGFNDGKVAVTVAPAYRAKGKYRATVTISAPAPSQPLTLLVTMTVVGPAPPPPPPPAVITGVLNAASRLQQPVAPGSLAVLTGSEFTATTEIQVGGVNSPIVGAGASEITVLVPSGLAPGRYPVVAYKGTIASQPFYMDIVEIAPAVFGILNADSSANTAANPAVTGAYIQVFGTGVPESSTPWVARIHDRWILEPDFAGPSPGSPGLAQFNFRVPADFPTMQTEVQICGTAKADPTTPVCSLGFKVWVLSLAP